MVMPVQKAGNDMRVLGQEQPMQVWTGSIPESDFTGIDARGEVKKRPEISGLELYWDWSRRVKP